ncbi:MAG: M20 family metallopeptidase [Acidobacteriota bacterium]|nr:M20 family metallopeptidase [Acidobacteriota bacterium]
MALPYRELLTYCQSQDAWLRETIEALVRLESPSHDKAAVDRCGNELERRLTDLGASVERLRQDTRGDHLRAHWKGTREKGQILLLGHFDTVWDVGSLEQMPLREVDGRLYGPGIYDMKSGIAVSMLAMRALDSLGAGGRPRVVMLWTTDEEIGSGTSRGVIEEEARRSGAVLVLEPSLPGGAVKTSRKGVGEFELIVHGVAAHAGLDPGKGASAIHELARQILNLEALQDPDRGVTINVGVITGGSRPNVVADRASARIDVRVQTMADAALLDSAIRGLRAANPAVGLEIDGAVERPPLERSPGVRRLYKRAVGIAAALGRDLPEGAAGGGSDGNFTAALGVPTLDGLGPQGDGAHALHEHVLVDDLTWRGAFLAGLIESFG